MLQCIHVTDIEWAKNVKDLNSDSPVNFWKRPGNDFFLDSGSWLYFTPYNFPFIIGRGRYLNPPERMSIEQAWSYYGLRNGRHSIGDLIMAARDVLEIPGPSASTRLLCVELSSLQWLPDRKYYRCHEDWTRTPKPYKILEAHLTQDLMDHFHNCGHQ
jgi:hypothetical protein